MPGTAIGKGLHTLDLLAGEVNGVTVNDVAAHLKIPKAGAHKVLNALVACNVVREDAAAGRYFLTLQLTRLGFLYLSRSGISAVYQPILDRLAEHTGELVRLALAEGERITWVGMAQGAKSGLRIAPDTGRDVNLHVTATGKAWLAAFALEHAVKLVLDHGFGEDGEFGPNAIHDVERLIEEVKIANKNGYAISVDEYIAGMSAVAMVIPGYDGTPLGTLSIAGPTARMTRQQMRKLCPLLKAAADELSALSPVLAGRSAG
ncbi:MAG: IclR family transcriptional regulator [Candidimonas sp.]